MSWQLLLQPSTKTDMALRLGVTISLFLWAWLISTHLEAPYHPTLVDLYAIPLTRLFILFLVLLSAYWCPTVGILAAFSYIMLGADVNLVLQ
jgi:hypothetical protein